MYKFVSVAIGVSLAAACNSIAVQPDVPALLTNPSETTLLEIEQAVSAAMDGAKVTLAADALTASSHLTIERGMRNSIDRPSEMGRDLGRPEQFQLVIDGPQCVLVHEKTGLHWLLKSVQCVGE